MSTCSNCYNGCAEIVSDQCVKYTGVNVPILGIQKGDSLSYVEQALVTFLTSTLNGSGIVIDIDESLYCELVTQYLQECETVTALDLFKALVQAACNLQEQVDTLDTRVDTIEANYTVDCLSGVSSEDGTHAIVQAIITKLCEIDDDLAALALDVDTNYVKISELNSYIAAYLASTTTETRYSSRMVPYSMIPYYGSLSFFDATGAGLSGTEWEDIYLCNGNNSTPDMRGLGITGAIAGVPGGALSSTVNPGSSSFNPNYGLGDTAGSNGVVLDTTQIPSHNHTTSITDPGHTHEYTITTGQSYTGSPTAVISGSGATSPLNTDYDTDSSTTGISVSINNTGGGLGHNNIQPVRAVYYIMYIPA